MGVIADVILAVAEVAVASGAIAEFQLRIAGICPAADSAAMGVGGSFFGTSLSKGNRGGLPGSGFFPFSLIYA